MTEEQQKYIAGKEQSVKKVDEDTVEIYYKSMNYLIGKNEINIAISQEREWLNLLYQARDLLQCPEKLHNEKWHTNTTYMPNFDNYDIT